MSMPSASISARPNTAQLPDAHAVERFAIAGIRMA